MPPARRKEATSARRAPAPVPPRRVLSPGAKALREHLAKSGQSHAEFASLIGVTRSHVGMLLSGSPPSLACAVRIEQLTNIRCADWLEQAA